MVDWHDPDDHRRDLQLCRLRLRRCHTGDAARGSIRRHHHHPVCYLPQGAPQLRWKDRLFLVHRWVSGYSSKCTCAKFGCYNTRHATFRPRSRILDLCRSHHRWVRVCRILGWASVWEEEYAGLPDHLQSFWWAQRCCNTRAGCCDCHPDQRDEAV